jgi:hypothetical protein
VWTVWVNIETPYEEPGPYARNTVTAETMLSVLAETTQVGPGSRTYRRRSGCWPRTAPPRTANSTRARTRTRTHTHAYRAHAAVYKQT